MQKGVISLIFRRQARNTSYKERDKDNIPVVRHEKDVCESPTSEQPNSTRPDAFLFLLDKKSVDAYGGKMANISKNSRLVGWYIRLFCVQQGTEWDAGRNDDGKKVIWSLQYIVRNDARHCVTSGVAIENTQMKFWFTCRAIALVSKPSNFFIASGYFRSFIVC
ncbi:hypothetical protein EDD15DRAFT_2363702 [Pisolithus albus]|nr:hypothetical protein EDD15DRAFT_2363702 [Pisolithus albus]